MLHTKFSEDRPYGSKVISIFVSHWNAWERFFFQILGVKNWPKRHLLGPNRVFWHIKRENRAVPWFMKQNKNKTKCHRRMNMLGMRRGKTRRQIFLKFGTHKFWQDVMTCANFGWIWFGGFGNTGVQSYRLPIDKALRAYNRVPTIVGTCDINVKWLKQNSLGADCSV